MQNVGLHALVEIFVYLVTVGFSFKAIKALKVESFIKPDHVVEAQIFLLFVAIALGYLVGSFLVMLMDNSLSLRMIFF